MDVTITTGRDRTKDINIDGDAGTVKQRRSGNIFVVVLATCCKTGDIGVVIWQVIAPSEDGDRSASTTRSGADFNLHPVQADAAAGHLLIINEIMVGM